MKKFDPARAAILDDAERLTYQDPERIIELLAIPPNGIVVDFGAGTGVYAIEIAERRPDARVIAIDEQPTMLERILAKPRGNRANLEARLPAVIPGRIGSVDRILALNVLHEIDDADLIAMHSLLRADGLALVIDWNPEVDRPRGPDAKHLADRAQAQARLTRFGFTAHEETGFPYHLAFVCRPIPSAPQ